MAIVSPLLVLQARAEARAVLYAANEFDLADALAPLHAFAVASGMVEQFGSDTVWAIIKAAFAGVAEL